MEPAEDAEQSDHGPDGDPADLGSRAADHDQQTEPGQQHRHDVADQAEQPEATASRNSPTGPAASA
jgi:hypothetical protein